MAERPILMSGEMVRALIENRKTETRRVMKFRHVCLDSVSREIYWDGLQEVKP